MKINLSLAMTAAITVAASSTAGQSLPQATVASQVPMIRRQVNLVSVYFTVRDGNRRVVPDLTTEQFRVFEDGREQQISAFSHHSDVPLNLGVLLDTSTRMANLLQAEAGAANLFLPRVVRLNDLAFVASHDSRVGALQVPTPQVALLEEKVSSITQGALPGGPAPSRPTFSWPMPGTPPGPVPQPNPDLREARLYDAVGISVARYLSQEVGRKAIVILALADDAKSEASLEDALYTLQHSDVIAYVLEFQHGSRDACDLLHIFRTENSRRLARLAEDTGGRVLEVRGRDRLRAAFEEIAEELHSQYSLGYYPTNQQWDSRFRRLEIRTQPKGYHMQARKGYYATPLASR